MTPKIKAKSASVSVAGHFEPWRVFYPEGPTRAKELGYAAERPASIEVNGTFYRSQTPATFRKWASEVPQNLVFATALKARHFAISRRVLKEAGDSIKRFLGPASPSLASIWAPCSGNSR